MLLRDMHMTDLQQSAAYMAAMLTPLQT